MEFVAGANAREWQAQAPRRWQDVLAMYMQAGRGLAAAHRQAGLIHRDFKPDNVMVGSDDRVRVGDFGLARADDDSQGDTGAPEDATTVSLGASRDMRLTATQACVGTPAYMAPEQHRGSRVDARADQYSFCASIYEAVYGVMPYIGEDRHEIFAAMLRGELQPPRRRADLPPRIHAALLRGLAIDPTRRWPDMQALLDALDLRPRRSRLARAGLGLVLSVSALASNALGLQRLTATTCDGAAAHIAPVWGPERRASVHAALSASKTPLARHTADRVVAMFDAYHDEWSQMHTEACEAHEHGEQSSDLLDRRMTCLARRLADLDAAVMLLGTADESVTEQAVRAAAALPPISECGDAEALLAQPKPSPALADAVAELRAELSNVEANLRAGQNAAAHPLAEQAVAQARALDYAPLVAEALLTRGKAEDAIGRVKEARATDDEAYAIALRAGHDVVAAEIATAQVYRTGVEFAQHDLADAWARQADALLHRAAAGPAGWIYFHRMLGSLHRHRVELGQARQHFEQALALAEQQPTQDRVAIARLRHSLANLLTNQEEYGAAVQQYERAIELSNAELGPDHPQIVLFKTNLGKSLIHGGQFVAAKQIFRDALALCERVRGSRHLDCAEPLAGLGEQLAHEDQHDEAARCLRGAIDIYEAALGPEAGQIGGVLINLGYTLRMQGDLVGAREQIERAQQIHRRWYGDSYALRTYELTELASIHIASGDPAAARPLLEQALTSAEQLASEPDVLADPRFELARILWSDPGQRPRALELARMAALGFRQNGRADRRHAEVVAWLARIAR